MHPITEIHTFYEIKAPLIGMEAQVLTPQALEFVTDLHRQFNKGRLRLLRERQIQQQKFDDGERPDFDPETAEIRDSYWTAEPVREELHDRGVELTGPIDRRMLINGLNSGAKVYMADFEDATTPTWENLLQGQLNLRDAIRREVDFTAENGRHYALNEDTAILMVRPRGLHLDEKHVLIEGEPVSGAFFDFGIYFFNNAHALIGNGTAPYFYLPKLENRKEARLWNEIFEYSERELDLPKGTIKATVLIETITAAFQMDEIIYELRERIAGLNAGRWDYIFSFIKKLKNQPAFILPDRSQVTMDAPFMRAYAQLLVRTCHRRHIHAMGGMAAFIPNRTDEEINIKAFEKVKADKEVEAATGFDGTWVAHPDLVKIAQAAFDKYFNGLKNQKNKPLNNVYITANELLNPHIPGAAITEAGVRTNINVGILYLESWLRGNGAAAIHNLMEDVATAEISRAQIWQWIHHQAKTDMGQAITQKWVKELIGEEVNEIRKMIGRDAFERGCFREAIALFEKLSYQSHFEDFLTLSAYEMLS